jgi:hypothetical protein
MFAVAINPEPAELFLQNGQWPWSSSAAKRRSAVAAAAKLGVSAKLMKQQTD